MADETDADAKAEEEFFAVSSHREDKTRETYEAWQKAEEKRRKQDGS